MNTTQNLETKLVPFMGADLMAAKDNDGQVWAAVRWLCAGIGLNKTQTNSQVEKIKSDSVLSKGYGNFRIPTNGGIQETACLHLEYVPLWLAKISITPTMERETPEVAERLVQYQLKAKDVLAAAFIPQYANQTAADFDRLTREKEMQIKELNARNRKQASTDKHLAMYLAASGTDKLFLLHCLRQDGYNGDTVDYVENALRAEIEGNVATNGKGHTHALKRGPAPVKVPENVTDDYQSVVDYLFANKSTLGIEKVVHGVKCYCIVSNTVRDILKQRGIYDRDFLKWAKNNGIILTGTKGYTLTVHITTGEQNQNCVCFILDKGGVSV